MSTVDPGLPPDPAAVAPPVDQSIVTTIQAATEFLYTGANPIQTGVVPGTIDATRAAVVRGKAMDRNNAPLAGVQITILDHPEFGQTLTRADGMFDLAVNGGGVLTVNGRTTSMRRSRADCSRPAGDGRRSDGERPRASRAGQRRQRRRRHAPGDRARSAGDHRDDDAARRRHAVAVDVEHPSHGVHRRCQWSAGDARRAATNKCLHLRGGAERRRGIAAGANEVRFSSPLPFYVENFLAFPIGTIVPLGGYDRTRGVWVAENSGTVIEILSVTGGLADLDLDGNGTADGSTAYAALSITDAERQQLALLYSPGQSFWRVLIPHFSPWDCNWPFEPPADAVQPAEDPEQDEYLEESCTASGSIIECQNQTLGEMVGISGTPFRLHYQSDRVPGHRVPYQIEIPLSGAQLPESVRGIELEVKVAGRTFSQSFPRALNQRTTFTWDGKDVYGRTAQGPQDVTVRIGYTYGGVYTHTGKFGYNGNGVVITGSRAREEVTLWHIWNGLIGAWDARGNGLGGWTLDAHHAYDPVAQVLYRGDGTRQGAQTIGPTIRTVAGRVQAGCSSSSGDGGPATQASLCQPPGVAVGPDGSFYVVELGRNRVRRVAPNGVISTVAGTGQQQPCISGPCGDGGPATLAPLGYPRGIAIGPDGSLYLDEGRQANPFVNATRIVRRIGPDGIITTFAGSGIWGSKGDGGPATQAQFSLSLNLAVGPDGSVYIADVGNGRIRRVGTDGIIDTVLVVGAGGIAVGGDGSLYFILPHFIRRMTPDGIISTIAGTGQPCVPANAACGDGGPATQATLTVTDAIAVDRYDNVYLYTRHGRIRLFRPGGAIVTIAGTGFHSAAAIADGSPARSVNLDGSVISGSAMAVAPDGGIYIAQLAANTVRRIAPIAAALVPGGLGVPSPDGAEVYVFDVYGRHLRTSTA
jgi:hypothetical protein